jgi:hypothetical protein
MLFVGDYSERKVLVFVPQLQQIITIDGPAEKINNTR